MSLRIAFMGTPEFSVSVLAELLGAGHEVVAVYSQPPRKAGRGMAEQPSPVHRFAQSHGLVVRTPVSLKSPEEQQAFADLDLDVAIVVAYGLILPKAILEAPRLGCLNLHASLLPRWRGAAPIQRAIMAGDAETGVMVMQMDEGLDTGPVLLAEHVLIAPTATSGSLHDELSHIGASLMVRALAALERGSLHATPQPDEGVTYAKKIGKEEARIEWSRPASELDCHIRGLTPFPGAFFEVTRDGLATRVKILRASPTGGQGAAGEILSLDGGITIACGDGALKITDLQRAGKGPMRADDFLRGFPFVKGERLA
ncbi:MAG: methionyl-tRNA formyltransferase [Parvibaculum sp.]|uniref:methionyl-tRNA formyltransferase n=1 Tax=Parvibaculum sp. TaxID=2024848 RepID=UPI003C74C65D